MPAQKDKKSGFAQTRLDPETAKRWAHAHERYSTTPSEVLTRLINAYLDEVEANDAVRWPITISLAPAQPQLRAAEDSDNYEHGAAKGKPPKPPDVSRRTRGAGPDHRVPKSA